MIKHLSSGIPARMSAAFCDSKFVQVNYLEMEAIDSRQMTISEYNDPALLKRIDEHAPAIAERWAFATEPLGPPLVDRSKHTLIYYYKLTPRK